MGTTAGCCISQTSDADDELLLEKSSIKPQFQKIKDDSSIIKLNTTKIKKLKLKSLQKKTLTEQTERD